MQNICRLRTIRVKCRNFGTGKNVFFAVDADEKDVYPPLPPLNKFKRVKNIVDGKESDESFLKRKQEYLSLYSAPKFNSSNSDDYFKYEIVYKSKKSNARVGRIHTPHGIINTPAFVPVGTNASLKGMDSVAADNAGVEIMFVNTYHMLVQPGVDLVETAGGLHKFMNRKSPIITDSGGFQVFSLQHGSVHDELNMKRGKSKSKYFDENSNLIEKISEAGVIFRSYRNGKIIELTPETSIQAQKKLGADIIIPFDELLPYHVEADRLLNSLHRTHRWQARSLAEHLKNKNNQAIYAVVHGGMDFNLRDVSIRYLSSLPFNGFAVGGSLGKDRNDLIQLMQNIMPKIIQFSKPVHLLGIADPDSIKECVPTGVDTFDSCYPTRLGRHGTLLLPNNEKMSMKKSENVSKFKPISEECQCHTCKHYTLAYLNHLYKANEPVAQYLGAIHNIQYMLDYMKKIRQDILDGHI